MPRDITDNKLIKNINAMDKAAEMKNAKIFNMIALGGLLKVCPVARRSRESAVQNTSPTSSPTHSSQYARAFEEGGKIKEKM